jgi:hypothetical protein
LKHFCLILHLFFQPDSSTEKPSWSPGLEWFWLDQKIANFSGSKTIHQATILDAVLKSFKGTVA